MSMNKHITSINKIQEQLGKWQPSTNRWVDELSPSSLAQEVSKISHIKRYLEMSRADLNHRNELADSEIVRSLQQFDCDPNIIKALEQKTGKTDIPEQLQSFWQFTQTELNWCQHIINLAGTSTNPRYRAWRSRQIARTITQVPDSQNGHFPVAFELSKGCSVGCWFCGVSAPRLGDIFFYTPENQKLWREVLEVVKETIGTAAGAGFGYCATDPLDNPDYELFLQDFHHILGSFPQTTTAQPLKNPDRTRYLLRLAFESGCMLNRFSIISLKQLRQLHQEFTPEELAFVGLVLQNPEAKGTKSLSGRARERIQRQAAKQQQTIDDSLSGTTACVTGFLFNLVDRTVKLISPCNASDRWPNGYQIYDQAQFKTATELQQQLNRMIDTHMPLSVQQSNRLQFRSDWQYEPLSDGFQLKTRFFTLKFCHDDSLKQIGELIVAGDRTVEQIIALMSVWGVSRQHTLKSLNLMFERGAFAEGLLASDSPVPVFSQ